MKKLLFNIRHSFSARLSLSILGVATIIFMLGMGLLFYYSRQSVRQAAVEEATQVLDNMSQRLTNLLNEVEVATVNTEWQVTQHLVPDSMFAYSRHIVEFNPSIIGCSISFEPYFFKEKGEYFSVYSYEDQGVIATQQEGSEQFRYFDLPWYKEAATSRKACWIDPFKDYNPEGIYAKEIIVSYCKPLMTTDGKFLGVISSDVSLQLLTQALAAEKRYPHSYAMFIGKSGNIIVSTNGMQGKPDLHPANHLVLQKQQPGTEWTLAVICPERDIFLHSDRLFSFIMTIIVFGLLIMLLLCFIVIRKTIAPLRILAKETNAIAEGRFDIKLATSESTDAIGQLQNSFSIMQYAIVKHLDDLKQMQQQIQQSNEELTVAKRMVEEAGKKKLAFMRDMSHQIRTPLNIISGFAQVLRDSHSTITPEEVKSVTQEILRNSHDLSTIISHLVSAATIEGLTTISRNDLVNCNELCHQAAAKLTLRHPETVKLDIDVKVPDSLQIRTNRECAQEIIDELMHNANKFTNKGKITISCQRLDSSRIAFTITDTGVGIPPEKREQIFARFTKLNSFNEGLGLGLPLCLQKARLLGGDLTLDTTYYSGTRLVFTLPSEL